MQIRNWNFPSTKCWQMNMMVHGSKQPCARGGLWDAPGDWRAVIWD